MTTYHTFGDPRHIDQAYEEDQDKASLKLLAEMLPGECLLLPFKEWEDLVTYNKELRRYYSVEWEFDSNTGFGKMKAYNIKGWEMKVYTAPSIERVEVRELDDELRMELAVAAL